jgi:hypothetical protein
MSELLEQVIAAHGGRNRWQQLKTVTAHVAIGGTLWQLKGWPDVFANAKVLVDPHRPHTEYTSFNKAGGHTLFEPDRVAVVGVGGKDNNAREAPRDAFSGHAIATPWDPLHLAYFSGYAMWTYLTTPFLLSLPGFRTIEIEPWNENGETWRRLKATFPADVPSHSREQTFYFDASGILRRHDYCVDVIGGSASANYAQEPKTFGGIVYPTKRRVYAVGPDNRPNLDRVAVAIDFHSIEPG